MGQDVGGTRCAQWGWMYMDTPNVESRSKSMEIRCDGVACGSVICYSSAGRLRLWLVGENGPFLVIDALEDFHAVPIPGCLFRVCLAFCIFEYLFLPDCLNECWD